MLSSAAGGQLVRLKPPLRQRHMGGRLVQIAGDVGELRQPCKQARVAPLTHGNAAMAQQNKHRPLLRPALSLFGANGQRPRHTLPISGAKISGGALLTQRRAVGQAHRGSQIHHRLIPRAGTLPVDGGGELFAEHSAHPRVCHVLRAEAEPRRHPQQVPVHRRLRRAEVDGGNGGGGVVPDAGEGAQGVKAPGQLAAVLRDDLFRRALQIPGAGIVTQALPELQKPLLRHLRQSPHVRQLLHEPGEVGQHRRHPGLLEHDLADPCAVGRRLLPPGQDTAVGVVPQEKGIAQGVQIFPMLFHTLLNLVA